MPRRSHFTFNIDLKKKTHKEGLHAADALSSTLATLLDLLHGAIAQKTARDMVQSLAGQAYQMSPPWWVTPALMDTSNLYPHICVTTYASHMFTYPCLFFSLLRLPTLQLAIHSALVCKFSHNSAAHAAYARTHE